MCDQGLLTCVECVEEMYPVGIEISFESSTRPIYAIVEGYEDTSDHMANRAVRIKARTGDFSQFTVLANHPSLYIPFWALEDFERLSLDS